MDLEPGAPHVGRWKSAREHTQTGDTQMMSRRAFTPRIAGLTVRAALAIALAGALGACASIPKRAWANGEAMSSSRAYDAVMGGDMSFTAHRKLQSSLDPRRLNYREVAFPAFGQWW
jgi:hypothetical protein